MALNLQNLEASKTRWAGPSQNYPTGSFINGTGEGKRNGSYCKAEWANELFGFLGSLISEAQIALDNLPETAQHSQYKDAIKKIMQTMIETLGGDPTAVASGTSDAITATFTKPVFLENGERVLVRATAANTTTTPTFQPSTLTAKTIVKGNNKALLVGDIAGSGFWMDLIYDATLDKWVLQNPATGTDIPDASETQSGVIQIAAQNDVLTATDNTKAVSPKKLFDNAVMFTKAQSLTDEQKQQARENIGATSADDATAAQILQAFQDFADEHGITVPETTNTTEG